MTSQLVDRTDRMRAAHPSGSPARPRPLVLISALGGVMAAAGPLVVCLAAGVVGWFAADAGAHGAPREGMRVGALAWLMAHGSGISVNGVPIDLMPLALTVLCAWTICRLGLRVGDAVSSHGPDSDRISDGERDLTVPIAAAVFFSAYAVVTVVAATLAATAESAPSLPKVLAWSLVLCLFIGAPAIAIGSGRAAIWATFMPAGLRLSLATAWSVLTGFLLTSTAVFAVAFTLGIGEVATMMGQLHLGVGEGSAYALVNAGFVPNATLFTGSFLLGPGFSVGVDTLVSPSLVVLGPLPLFALLAALPTAGTTATWLASMVALPPLVAAVAVARRERRTASASWSEAALRGCGGGILAAVAFAVLVSLAGGTAGPGRMQYVGASAFDVLVHAVPAFGLGGLAGALLAHWWMRRGADAEPATTLAE